jgi:2,4-dienoyl-CoA reductase-like NADH-dependent reductase (Old Yellow Enzyme family)
LDPALFLRGPAGRRPWEMDVAAIDAVVADFVDATKRADQAGFDVIELHFGHGYLVTSFLSPLSNLRTDSYGCDRAGRMKLALRITSEVRNVWPLTNHCFAVCQPWMAPSVVGVLKTPWCLPVS